MSVGSGLLSLSILICKMGIRSLSFFLILLQVVFREICDQYDMKMLVSFKVIYKGKQIFVGGFAFLISGLKNDSLIKRCLCNM